MSERLNCKSCNISVCYRCSTEDYTYEEMILLEGTTERRCFSCTRWAPVRSGLYFAAHQYLHHLNPKFVEELND